MVNERIRRLRQQSLEARATLSAERALLVTRLLAGGRLDGEAVPVQRAGIFKHVMEEKTICVTAGELIVGDRGPAPKATPTYPEVCLHSLDDLELLHERPKVAYRSDADTRRVYAEEIIPFWRGRTIRERIFARLPEAWKAAYRAGVFTEFQEQRSPGHTVLGDTIYRKGFLDLKQEIADALGALDFYNDPRALDKQEQLQAMDIAADALIVFARRHARELSRLAAEETDPGRVDELRQMAAICRKVPAHKPDTFWEALQYYWFVHVGVITELNPWDAFNPGRLDQHLYPFYRRDIARGDLTEARARELLQAFWIKFNNHPAPPKVGVTAKESNTYVDFALINTGGLTAEGADGVNELSYLILDVVEEMRLLQPSAMVQISKKTPDRFLKRALHIVKTGFGQPSIFNTDAIVQELVRQGKSIEDARRGGASGCVESGAFGREAYILTGYFNLPKILELTLHDGIDPLSGERIGPATGAAADFASFEDLFKAFEHQLQHFVDIKILGNNIIERINARDMPAPFLLLLIDDCIAKGADYNAGGARYNSSYIQGVGMGSLTDSLSAIKHILKDDVGIDRLAQLVRTYFRMDGHHIQFNVVDAATLRRAQEAPEDHRDLIVRVAGYSDYFVDLTPELQEEIIQRTAHDDG